MTDVTDATLGTSGLWLDLCTAPRIISLSPLSLASDVTDATLGASGLWLGTRTGPGGIATLTKSFFGCSPWLHGKQVYQTIGVFLSCKVNANLTFAFLPDILCDPIDLIWRLVTPFEAVIAFTAFIRRSSS